MEGKYIWYDKNYQKDKHDHIQFVFTDGNSLVYNDVRKFGTMYLVKKGEEFEHPSLKKLGP
jgi:formamidopyrimidine-DNA glycosylase